MFVEFIVECNVETPKENQNSCHHVMSEHPRKMHATFVIMLVEAIKKGPQLKEVCLYSQELFPHNQEMLTSTWKNVCGMW